MEQTKPIPVAKRYQLPREFSENWLEALKTGKYRKINYRLCNWIQDGCCAVGAAALANGFPGAPITDKSGVIRESMPGYENFPEQLCAEQDLFEDISTMNDEGFSFEEIAAWIEENVDFV